MNGTGATRAEQSAEDILHYIKESNLKPGDKLPTEVELSKMLGVGRNTVREALRLLLSRNIVNIRQGAGSFVSDKNGVMDDPLGFSMVEDRGKLLQELLQVRVMMEPQIAAMAAQNRTDEELQALERALKKVEETMKNRLDFAEEDSEFHACIARCAHNGVIAELVPVITRGVAAFSSGVKRQEYEQTLISHRNIYIAIRDQKSVEAEQAMNYHLLYNKNRYLQEI